MVLQEFGMDCGDRRCSYGLKGAEIQMEAGISGNHFMSLRADEVPRALLEIRNKRILYATGKKERLEAFF